MNTQTLRSRPFPGSVTARVWEIADDLLQCHGTLPSGRQVVDAYLAEDPARNEGTAFTQYSHWKKAHLAQSSPVQPAPAPQSGQLYASADGSLTIPAQFVRHLNLGPEGAVYIRATADELHLASPMTELRKLQALLAPLRRPGQRIDDELIADRRAEAARE